MRHRPLTLILYALTMAGISLSFPLQALWLQDRPLLDLVSAWHFLSDINLLVMVMTAALAYLAYHGSSLLLYAAPATLAVMAVNNWWVGSVGFDFAQWQTALATLAFALAHSPLAERRTLGVLLNPQTRWWRTAERKRASFPVTIRPAMGIHFLAESFDVSETGIFIATPSYDHLRIGERVQLQMWLDEGVEVDCTARVVRTNTKTSSSHPVGLGLAFEDLSRHDRRKLGARYPDVSQLR